MKKIVSLFQRNYDGDRLVRDEVVPGSEWVIAGEGVATRKYDGTACMVKDGVLYARYDAKAFTVDARTGEKHAWDRKPPEGAIQAQEPDEKSGHWPHWVLVGNEPQFRWHREAWGAVLGSPSDGTYELIGPKIQGNPEGRPTHTFIAHGCDVLNDAPRTHAALKAWFETVGIEGIVWHHPDLRMVKIKRKDFGYPWPIKK